MSRSQARALPSPRPALQHRSARTQARILSAAEALLVEGDAAGLTMENLADRAHVSVGAIYKRFQGKASLLPLLLARVQEHQFEQMLEYIAPERWMGKGLSLRIAALVECFAAGQLARQRLLRALVVDHLQSTQPAAVEARSTELLTAVHGWLSECSDEIDHPDPRLALSLGLFATLQSVQTAILFDRVPPHVGMERFVAEMTRMFQRYLLPPAPAS